MIRLRPSGADEVLIKRVRDWYEPGPGVFVTAQSTFSPLSLFASGAQGVWYDPSDFSTMFQDSAGTTPVTAVGQSVGKILDKSGRGNHATQATAGNRPVLQQDSSGRYYLLFNGTSSSMATSSIDFTATDKMFVSAGVRKLSDAVQAVVVELNNIGVSNQGFSMLAPQASTAGNYRYGAGGTAFAQAVPPSIYPSPISNVLSGTSDLSVFNVIARVNGVVKDVTITTAQVSNYGNYPLYIGARAGSSLFFNGRLHQLVVAGKAASAAEISSTESYINQRTGAY